MWDLPLEEQSDHVQDAMIDLIGLGEGINMDEWTGQDLYNHLSAGGQKQRAASLALNDAGIPGLKYLDQDSRAAEQFVTIDGERVTDNYHPASAFAADQVMKAGSLEGAVAAVDAQVEEGGKLSFLTGDAEANSVWHEAQFQLKQWQGLDVKIEMEKQTYNFVVFDETAIEVIDYHQIKQDKARGSIQFFPDGKIVINLGEASDLSTFLHEAGHLFVHDLTVMAETNELAAADLGAMMKFVGAESMEGFRSVENQEKLARAFEAYLREGKAPSAALEGAFSRFQNWLLEVYKTLKGLNIELDDEIRGVFDRMLATDEEIAAAENAASYLPMPGIDDLMYDGGKAYALAGAKARAAAVEDLKKKKIAAAAREAKAEWRAELDDMEEEELAKISALPAYRAIDAINTTGNHLKLSLVEDIIDPAEVAGHVKILKRTGVDPEAIAGVLGYDSGDAMLRDIAKAERTMTRRIGLAKEFALERMREKHGTNDPREASAEQAGQAVVNDERGTFLAMELKALSERAKKQTMPAAIAKAAAQRILRDRPLRRAIKDRQFAQAAAKAGRDSLRALLAEDYAGAYEAKMRQILNHYLSLESRKIAEAAAPMIDRMARWGRRPINPKNVNPGFIKQVKALLADITFTESQISQDKFDRLASETLQEWNEQQARKYGSHFHISSELDNALSKQNVYDMTVAELGGLHDTVASLMKMGRKYSDAQDKQFGSLVGNIAVSVNQKAKKKYPHKIDPGPIDGISRMARMYLAEHRRIDALSDELDGFEGFETNGVYRNVYLRVKEADDAYIKRTGAAGTALEKIFKMYTRRERTGFSIIKKFIPSLNQSLSRNARLSFALNMGNAGNVEAMENEYDEQQIGDVLRTLTNKDWDVVEAIWAHVNEYKDDIMALEERTTGVKPSEVEAVPFLTPSGREVTGGYYPLVADPTSPTGKQDLEDRASIGNLLGGGRAKSTTKAGSTIERKGWGNERRIWLDMSAMFSHVDGVIKDIEMREAVVDAYRIVNHPKFKDAVSLAKGLEHYEMFNDWLEHVVGGNKVTETSLEKAGKWARAGVSLAEMGFSVRTMLQQPMGITMTVAMIGEKYTALGVAEFLNERTVAMRRVMELSPFMAERARTFHRDVRDAQKLMGVGNLQKDIASAAFWGIQKLDMAVSMPTWLGAHRKALNEGMSPQDAIHYADGIVSRSQGTGLARDMADIQNTPGIKKVFTMFYSFFGAYHNLQTDLWKQTNFKNPVQALKYAKNQVWITLLPSLLIDYLFQSSAPDGDDDEETWAKWAAGSVSKFALGGLVGIRDIAGGIASGFGYEGSPAFGLLQEPVKLAQQVGQGEVDEPLVKAMIMLTSYGAKIPGGRAATRAYGVLEDEGTDELDTFEGWWRMLVAGKKRK